MASRIAARGLSALEQAGVAFEVVEYLFKQKGAGRAANAVGWPEERVLKSLVVQVDSDRDYRFALVPSHCELSTKKLARLLNAKHVDLAAVRDAERLTGYVQGGISPFGSYATLPVLMDELVFEHERVLINAGRRGVLVAMSPWDIQELLDAAIENIVA